MDPSLITLAGVLILFVSALLMCFSKPFNNEIEARLKAMNPADTVKIGILALFIVGSPFAMYGMILGLNKLAPGIDSEELGVWIVHAVAWIWIAGLIYMLFSFFFDVHKEFENAQKEAVGLREKEIYKPRLSLGFRYFTEEGEPRYRYHISKTEIEIFNRFIDEEGGKERKIHPRIGSELPILDKAAIEQIGFKP